MGEAINVAFRIQVWVWGGWTIVHLFFRWSLGHVLEIIYICLFSDYLYWKSLIHFDARVALPTYVKSKSESP